MKELHLIETNGGKVLATIHKSRVNGYYVGTMDDITISCESESQCLELMKKAYEIHLDSWLKYQLINTGVSCEK